MGRTKKAKKQLRTETENLEFATVQVPSVLPRVIRLPAAQGEEKQGRARIILLETVIRENMASLFQSYDIVCAYPFRIMRSADMDIDEDEAEDLLKEIEKSLKQRRHGDAIRLEVESGMDRRLLNILVEELQLSMDEIFEIDGPLDLTFLSKVRKLIFSRRYGKGTFSCIIHMRHLSRSLISSRRQQSIRMCWRSSRRCTV